MLLLVLMTRGTRISSCQISTPLVEGYLQGPRYSGGRDRNGVPYTPEYCRDVGARVDRSQVVRRTQIDDTVVTLIRMWVLEFVSKPREDR